MQRIATVVMNPGSASRALKLGLRGVCRADVGSSSVDYSKPFKLSAESLRGFVQYLAETSPINVAVGHKFLVCLLDKSIAVTHADFQHLKMATAIWGKDQAAERTAFSGGYLPITSLGNNKLLFFFSSSSTHYDDDLGRPSEEVSELRQETLQAFIALCTEAGLGSKIKMNRDDACMLEIAIPIG